MKLFLEYLKKKRIKIILSIIILVGEAITCIASPILLGNIINVGVQSSGFDDEFPIVMNYSSLDFFANILPENIYKNFSDNYFVSYTLPDNVDGKYSTLLKKYYIKADADKNTVKEIYENAIFSVILYAKNKYKLDSIDYDTITNKISAARIASLSDDIILTKTEKEELYLQSSNTPSSVKHQFSRLVLPYVYEYSGIDCEKAQKNFIGNATTLLVILIAMQCILAAISGKINSDVSTELEYTLREKLLKKASKFTRDDFFAFSPQSIFLSYNTHTRQVGMALNFALRNIFLSVSIVIFGCIYSFGNSLWFGGIILLIFLVLLVVFLLLYKICSPKYYRMQATYYKYSSKIKTNLKYIFSIRSFGAQSFEAEKNDELSEAIYKDESFVMKSVLLALSTIGLFINLLTALVVVIGGNDILVSDITLGNIVSDLQISLLTVSSLLNLSAMFIFSPTAFSAVKKIEEILSYQNDASEKSDNEYIKVNKIEFRDFRQYEDSNVKNFVLNKGKITALVGPSGSGKSMLINSLLRETKACSGSVLINDIDINRFEKNFPANSISYVPSNPVIFTDTVRNNMLLFGAEDNSEIMLNALDKAGCDFFINKENILDVFLDNGAEKYSGGQRSRLSLAFAISKKSDVYIFDDCLSSLDSDTKNKIMNNIVSLKNDAIIIIVSQDKNDVDFADEIIIFSK